MSQVDWTQATTRGEVVAKNPEPLFKTDPEGSWGFRSLKVDQAPSPSSREGAVLRLLANSAFVLAAVTGSSGMVLGTAAVSHTFGGRSASYPDSEQEQWEQMNRRRIFLLEKERTTGLDSDHAEELRRLREHLGRALSALDPLPFDRLNDLERRVGELKGRRDQNG